MLKKIFRSFKFWVNGWSGKNRVDEVVWVCTYLQAMEIAHSLCIPRGRWRFVGDELHLKGQTIGKKGMMYFIHHNISSQAVAIARRGQK